MEDDKIIQLFLERDERAINKTAEKYGSRIRRVSFSITSDMQTAEECENDTYMQAWKSIPPNEPKTYFFPYLACITRHISINRCRNQKSLKRGMFITELNKEMEMCIPSLDNVESDIEAKELGKAISKYLHKVSAEKRVIFMRRYFYMDSIPEIGKRCALSESKIKSVLFRMRKDLRQFLLKEGYEV